jgi:hypothetical protein
MIIRSKLRAVGNVKLASHHPLFLCTLGQRAPSNEKLASLCHFQKILEYLWYLS